MGTNFFQGRGVLIFQGGGCAKFLGWGDKFAKPGYLKFLKKSFGYSDNSVIYKISSIADFRQSQNLLEFKSEQTVNGIQQISERSFK